MSSKKNTRLQRRHRYVACTNDSTNKCLTKKVRRSSETGNAMEMKNEMNSDMMPQTIRDEKSKNTEGEVKPTLSKEDIPSVTPVDNSKSSTCSVRSYKEIYILIVILTSLFTIGAFYLLSRTFYNVSERIVEIQQRDYVNLSHLLSDTCNTCFPVDEKGILSIEEIIDKHYERTESLLELQYNKLQNDFNFLSMWAAVITIVFLVFSIYSIFKTDEMLSRAKDETAEIHKMSLEAKVHSTTIESDIKLAEERIKTLQGRAEKIETQLSAIETRFDNMNKSSDGSLDASEDSNDETEREK